MADSTISSMTAASTLDGTELLYGVQGGADRKVTAAQIKTLTRSDILPVANGGTGTATPGIVAGTNVTVSGSWPNQTVNASGGGASLSTANTWTATQTFAAIKSSYAFYANNGAGDNVAAAFGSDYSTDGGFVIQRKDTTPVIEYNTTDGMKLAGGLWLGKTVGSTATDDTKLARNAAGVVEINNGTAGTYRDLKLRNLEITGTLTGGGGGGFTGSYAGGTVTANTPISFSQTWNNGAVAFTGLNAVITKTAAAGTSRVIAADVGGSRVFSVDVEGSIIIAPNGAQGGVIKSLGEHGVVIQRGDFSEVGKITGFGASCTKYMGFLSGVGGSIDTALERTAAGALQINNGSTGTFRDLTLRNVKTDPTTVASLVAAATAGAGARSFVTDATAPTFGATVAGGGAVATPVYSDGANWKVG